MTTHFFLFTKADAGSAKAGAPKLEDQLKCMTSGCAGGVDNAQRTCARLGGGRDRIEFPIPIRKP